MSLRVLSTMAVSWVISLMTLELSWTISVPTLGLLVAARADSRISPMCGMYTIHMNHSFGSYFFRHLTMEFVRFDGVPARNEVMSSEEAFRETSDAISNFFTRVLDVASSEVIDSASVSVAVLGLGF